MNHHEVMPGTIIYILSSPVLISKAVELGPGAIVTAATLIWVYGSKPVILKFRYEVGVCMTLDLEDETWVTWMT